MSNRCKLRKKYYKETLKHWKTLNTTATPTIDYVKWLEDELINGMKSIDIEKIEKKIDEVLDNEKSENIKEWLKEKRK